MAIGVCSPAGKTGTLQGGHTERPTALAWPDGNFLSLTVVYRWPFVQVLFYRFNIAFLISSVMNLHTLG